MRHLTKAASVEDLTELGEFTALAAAYTVDRQGDVIAPGAFRSTIERWQESGKRIPVHWNHESRPSSIIGWIDPMTMAEGAQGLYVSGELDLANSSTAREAWRAMRTGSMGLSFGYLTGRSRKREDGIRELSEVDLFEVSIVPHPANDRTKVLSMKSAGGTDMLRQRCDEIEAKHGQIVVAAFAC